MGKVKISVPNILGIVFIILKLCGVIEWSWVWVLSPFWIGLLVCVLAAIIECKVGSDD